ncbi:hypothetical protein ASPCAL10490 [Aspergillus calidoustus]|uniref:Phosphatidylglycerol lysyltransferase C-terminal domain-containing protein n=1 Tax=Aspergillus calidoustus TaxID=454130 RepID=A0A0U5G5G5_ASPCI|nr:hypothetical protein ASPCAL10490 [Aspergillus calidoustus]
MWLSVPTNNDSSSTESTYSYMTSSSSTRPPSFSSSSSYDPRSEAGSRGTAGSTETVPHVPSHPCTRYPSTLRVASLSGKASIRDVEQLAVQYGSMAHMGLLDPSYSVFVNEAKTGAICFKTLYKIAVVMGDPMCDLAQIASLLSEFSLYRRRKRWGMAVLGAKTELVRYFSEGEAESRSTILQFARERVLNPLTNSVVNETSGKRILTQCRQLLDARKGGLTLHIYIPSLHGPDHRLEAELRALYDDWRTARNKSRRPQAFITQYDPFLMPHLMTYIYTTGPDGAVNGFAALRWIGANDGYHIDPCIAAPGSRNGISDLLLFAAMAYLRQLGVSHLSLGLEPLESIEPVSEMSPLLAHLTQRIYQHTFRRLPIPGKRAYFDKFKPDDNQDAPVYLIFSSTIPEPRQVVAVAHIANISIRRLFIREKQKEAS